MKPKSFQWKTELCGVIGNCWIYWAYCSIGSSTSVTLTQFFFLSKIQKYIEHVSVACPLLALTHLKNIPRGWVAFTSCRLKHRLCVSILLGLHSLPSPEVQMIRDHHGACGGSRHAVEDRRGHFGGCSPLKNSSRYRRINSMIKYFGKTEWLYMCRPPKTTLSRGNYNFTNTARGKDKSDNTRW